MERELIRVLPQENEPTMRAPINGYSSNEAKRPPTMRLYRVVPQSEGLGSGVPEPGGPEPPDVAVPRIVHVILALVDNVDMNIIRRK